jgi:hypothetical protein
MFYISCEYLNIIADKRLHEYVIFLLWELSGKKLIKNLTSFSFVYVR